MKSMLLIGLGDFGRHLCRALVRMKNEVFVMDRDEAVVEELRGLAAESLIADCTTPGVLERVGVADFDVCFVCFDADFKCSLVTVDRLKALGARYVVCQTEDDLTAKFLLKNGADEVVYPNEEAATRSAVKYSSEHVFDYIELRGGYSIYEITPPGEWVGRSILASRIRECYDTYIIGILPQEGEANIMPSPQTVIRETDHLMVLAREKTVAELVRRMEK